MQLLEDGLVRLELRRPFKDGTIAVDLDTRSRLCRLGASVLAPRMYTVRFAEVLSAAHRWRWLVVPGAPEDNVMLREHGGEHAGDSERPAAHSFR